MPVIGSRSAFVAVAIGAATLVGGGTAVAALGLGNDAPAALAWSERTVPVTTAVSTTQTTSFGILRRDRGVTDQIPRDAALLIGNSEISGRNVDLSRAFTTPAGRRGWVVPGNGTICLAVPDETDGYGITCQTDDTAATLGVPIMTAAADELGAVHLSLLAPDEAVVTAEYQDGSTTRLEPRSDGVIAATLRGGPTVHIKTDRGSESFKVPVPTAPAAPGNPSRTAN